MKKENKITSWPQFAKKIRTPGRKLLARLDLFPSPVLVSGCQRSGTTILTDILLRHPDLYDYRQGGDSELEGALILAGAINIPGQIKRTCFQTTYLNENYQEYFDYCNTFRMIWVIRNPYSVVYSMCYHWKRKLQVGNFALNELFNACGAQNLNPLEKRIYNVAGGLLIPSFRKACLAYVGKTEHLFELAQNLKNNITVIDYDDLIMKKEQVLPYIFHFVGLEFSDKYSAMIHGKGISRASGLSLKQKKVIKNVCMPTYKKARAFAKSFSM